jgi:hypothetical protein
MPDAEVEMDLHVRAEVFHPGPQLPLSRDELAMLFHIFAVAEELEA